MRPSYATVMLRTIVLFSLLAEGLCHFYRRHPTVNSPAGRFRGETLRAPCGRLYHSYRGIPYAKPPVGDLRFANPQPLPRIQKTFAATNFGPICVQPSSLPDRGQEDCLSLNVFTNPRLLYFGMKLKPVLVFIHGGGLVSGSSKDLDLPGNLVTRGDIVVVTMNYRLGLLGFLRGNTDQLPGNQAVKDILLSLRWVRDNIRHFGGDPDDVTLGGHSAGSNLAAALSVSPLAQGLYQKAILFSGGYLELPFPPRTTNDLLVIAATNFGCSDSVTGQSVDVDSATACLKNIPALDFDTSIAIQNLLGSSEDDVFPIDPKLGVRDEGYLSGVGFFTRSYLLSTTKDDGIVFVDSNLFRLNTSAPEENERDVANFFGLPVETVALILTPYRTRFSGNEERALTAFFTDFFIRQNIDFISFFNNKTEEDEGGDAFLMSFDYQPSYIRDMLVLHGLELVYLFDLTPQGLLNLLYSTFSLQGSFTRRDRRLQNSFIDLITDFVKTGNPGRTLSKKFDINWTPYDPHLKNYLSFSLRPELEQDLQGRLLAAT